MCKFSKNLTFLLSADALGYQQKLEVRTTTKESNTKDAKNRKGKKKTVGKTEVKIFLFNLF